VQSGAVQAPGGAVGTDTAAAIKSQLALIAESYGYRIVTLVDVQGRPLLSTHEPPDINAVERAAVAETIRTGDTVISDFHFSVEKDGREPEIDADVLDENGRRMLQIHLYPAKLVLAPACGVGIAQPDHHALDPVAGPGKGEAQAPVVNREELERRALIFKANLLNALAKHPDQTFVLGVDSDIGKDQQAQIMPIYKAIDQLQELKDSVTGKPLLPNLLVVRASGQKDIIATSCNALGSPQRHPHFSQGML